MCEKRLCWVSNEFGLISYGIRGAVTWFTEFWCLCRGILGIFGNFFFLSRRVIIALSNYRKITGTRQDGTSYRQRLSACMFKIFMLTRFLCSRSVINISTDYANAVARDNEEFLQLVCNLDTLNTFLTFQTDINSGF